MFERAGFIHLATVKNMLTVENLPQEEREFLILHEKRREAESMVHQLEGSQRRHIDEDWFKKEVEALIPKISSRQIKPDLKWHSRVAFFRFLRTKQIYALPLSGEPVALTIGVLDTTKDMRSRADSGIRDYIYLDDESMTLDIKTVLTAIELSQALTRHPLLSEMHKAQLAYLRRVERWRAGALALLPLDGSGLGISDVDKPSAKELLEAFRFSSAGTGPGIAGGRPRKQERAAEAYAERFPNGHGAYTWKEVLRILEVECGLRVSEATLRAAISSLESPQ